MSYVKPLLDPQEILLILKEGIRPGVLSFSRLRTQLPAAGRSHLPIAATERMTVILKSYAEGMLRVGYAEVGSDIFARIRIDGAPLPANSTANRQVAPLLSDKWFPTAAA